MSKIIPIRDLRDTKKIEEFIEINDEPIMVTKNGYSHLVILSNKYYEENFNVKNFSSNQTKSSNSYNSYIKNLVCKEEHFGFVKVGCYTFEGKVADVKYNYSQIVEGLNVAAKEDVQILVFPELCLPSYTCSDLFYQDELYKECSIYLGKLVEDSKKYEMLFVIGSFFRYENSLYNVAIVISKGKILGIVPKQHIPNYKEFYEKRHFKSGNNEIKFVEILNQKVPFGVAQIYVNEKYNDLKIGIEICEDLWVTNPPSNSLSLNGANLILNLSASNEIIGKAEYRRLLVSSTSARQVGAYVYCSSGYGESTTDLVFSGHSLICSNGRNLAEAELFKLGLISAYVDIERLVNERRSNTTYEEAQENYLHIPFDLELKKPVLDGKVPQNPFIFTNFDEGKERYRQIIQMQSYGLLKRFKASASSKLIIGLSGGLDSTLALLVAINVMDILKRDRKDVVAISLPAFGTSDRTFNNSKNLAIEAGVTYKEINISKTLLSHFEDINHDIKDTNVTFENAQARERTQVLLDYANDVNGLMVGTGDLSELCLGWTTYAGDHMSNYSVNSSIPKTLVKELVRTYAYDHEEVEETLLDILDTPISPELLPTKDGEIAQKTEDFVGPYELHDFFIYYFLRHHFSAKKIYFLACAAYKNKYDEQTILKWLKVFFRRFFIAQFKRSCLPDGVKVGSVSISPRGDFRMPSDASIDAFLKDEIFNS